MRVLAVDFGTSNTVAALAEAGGAPRLLAIDGSPLVPSSLFLTDDGTLAVGRDADRQARLDPSRFEPNPKRRIDEGDILLGSTPVPVVGAIAAVLRRVGGEVVRQLGGRSEEVRLTHPARWGRRRRDTLVAACREAGLADDPVLIPEPVAAATHFATLSGHGLADGSALAVYDLGGGTFDVAVVARRGAGYEVLAEAGLPDLGGLDFEHAIVEHIGHTHAVATDPDAWRRLLIAADPASRRAARALATDVRDGKEALSRYPHVDIALPPPFADAHLTRAEFEELIRPNLTRSVELLARTIADAGFAAADRLAGVYLVGGSSRIPLVARLIQQHLGVTPTTLDQPETSVATGALYLPTQPTAAGTEPPGSAARHAATPPPLAPYSAGAATPSAPAPTAPAPSAAAPPLAPYSTGAAAPTVSAPAASLPPLAPYSTGPAAPSGSAPAASTSAAPSTPAPAAPYVGPPTGPFTGPSTGPSTGVGSAPSATPPSAAPPPAPAGPRAPNSPAGYGGPGRTAAPGWGSSPPPTPPRGQSGPPPNAAVAGYPNARAAPGPSTPRPYPGPGGPIGPGRFGPPQQGQYGPPARPVAGFQPSRQLIVIGSSILAAVLLLVVGVAVINASTNTKFDEFFADQDLRDYVRPFYDDITSCAKTSDASAEGADCRFASGEQVALVKLNDGVSISEWRDRVDSVLSAADTTTWRDGQLRTLVSGPAALYWDVEGRRISGIAIRSDGNLRTLQAWWESRFGR